MSYPDSWTVSPNLCLRSDGLRVEAVTLPAGVEVSRATQPILHEEWIAIWHAVVGSPPSVDPRILFGPGTILTLPVQPVGHVARMIDMLVRPGLATAEHTLLRLEQENLRLRAENAYLKKLRALREHGRQ